jgi:hypothetical protein
MCRDPPSSELIVREAVIKTPASIRPLERISQTPRLFSSIPSPLAVSSYKRAR